MNNEETHIILHSSLFRIDWGRNTDETIIILSPILFRVIYYINVYDILTEFPVCQLPLYGLLPFKFFTIKIAQKHLPIITDNYEIMVQN